MTISKKTIVAVLSDLMFTVKIQDAAKRAGLDSVFVQSQTDALAAARQMPTAMIFDLNYGSSAPLETIAALKADGVTSAVPLIGFVSHVQTELRQAAAEKGCDVVVARSAFSQNLPEMLKRYAGG